MHNAGELGPSPLPALQRLPARRAARRPGDHRARPARAHPARAAAAARLGRRHRGHPELGRRRRGLPRLGRLRRRQGRARPARRGARGRGAGSCGCTRSTRATCAPPCTSAPFPARTSPTGRVPETVVPALAAAARRAAAERPAAAPPTCWPRPRVVRPATAFTVAPELSATGAAGGPRPGPRRGAAAGGPRSAAAAAPAVRRPARGPCAGATWSWSTPRTPSRPRSTGAARDGRAVALHVSGPVPGGDRRGRGRAAHAGRAPGRATPRPASGSGCPGGAAATLLAGHPDPARTTGSRLWRARIPVPAAATAGCARSDARSATPTCADAGRWPPTAPCSPEPTGEFGSAEMPSAARPFTPGVLAGLHERGRRGRRAGAAHRGVVARGRRGAAARALPGARGHRATR